MRFEEKLHRENHGAIWQEYCGFLDLSMDEYMKVQSSLLMEQIDLLSKSKLGNALLQGKVPRSIDEFRRTVPLTTYDDYVDTLLMGQVDALPSAPLVWLETTWEGGSHPKKTAPYSKGMLDTYAHNLLAAMLLSTSQRKGNFRVRPRSKVLYTLAPLPYPTGLFPELMKGEVNLRFLPPLKEALAMPFSKQMARGFELAVKHGMNQLFGMSSILYYVSNNLLDGAGPGVGWRRLLGMSPVMLLRLLRARYRSHRDGVPMLPKDIFKLDAFVCVGNDSTLYKPQLERCWGKKPTEIAGGTEPTLIGTETWSKDGLVLFPDACFYEFIPEKEMWRSLEEPGYVPRTYLMSELNANHQYELVITVLKGGSFVRYRVGDVYRCLRLTNPQDGLSIPQFEFVDRTPNIIDIGGFTRITAREISKVIQVSRLPIKQWCACKEYNSDKLAYLHMFVELQDESPAMQAAAAEVVKEHLSIYFRYYDQDYVSLKKLIHMDPLQVTVVRSGSFRAFEELRGHGLRSVNPPACHIVDFCGLCGLPQSGGANAWQ
ncbi:MAG: GH3 auxin-responsive promoter family protein [Christensenellales bacterium]